MAGKKKDYIKLPGTGRRSAVGSAGFVSLWLGQGLLLQVERSRYTEEYKRFYLKDIKVIILRRTRGWAIANWILAGIAALFAGLFGVGAAYANARDREGFLIGGACVAGVFLLALVISLLLGPTCECHIRTPVQQEKLVSLKRLRTARKAVKRIREAIEQVQGTLTKAEQDGVAALIAGYENLSEEEVRRLGSFGGPPSLHAESVDARWRLGLIAALLVQAVAAIAIWAGYHGQTMLGLNGIANCGVGATVILLFANLPKGASRMLGWLRIALWGVWMAVVTTYFAIAGFKAVIGHPGRVTDMNELMAAVDPSYYNVTLAAGVLFVFWALLEGLGLFRAWNQRPLPAPAQTGERVSQGEVSVGN